MKNQKMPEHLVYSDFVMARMHRQFVYPPNFYFCVFLSSALEESEDLSVSSEFGLSVSSSD